jgi:integrase
VTQRRDELTVRERLNEVALERDLRPSTRICYLRCLQQLGLDLDEPVSAVTRQRIEDAAWQLANANTRRNALIAARTTFGFKVRIGRAVPRHYDLPSDDEVTRDSIHGRHLRIDRQVQSLRQTGQPTVTRVVATKGAEADVWCPEWLLERVRGITEWDKPDACREGIKRAFRKVGRNDLTCHSLRHFFATSALDRGAPIKLVSRALRHSDIATTLRVYHDTKIDAMEAFWT